MEKNSYDPLNARSLGAIRLRPQLLVTPFDLRYATNHDYENQMYAESTVVYLLIKRAYQQNVANESVFSAIYGGGPLGRMYALHIHIVRPAGPRIGIEKCVELVRDKRRRETCEKVEQRFWRASVPRY